MIMLDVDVSHVRPKPISWQCFVRLCLYSGSALCDSVSRVAVLYVALSLRVAVLSWVFVSRVVAFCVTFTRPAVLHVALLLGLQCFILTFTRVAVLYVALPLVWQCYVWLCRVAVLCVSLVVWQRVMGLCT